MSRKRSPKYRSNSQEVELMNPVQQTYPLKQKSVNIYPRNDHQEYYLKQLQDDDASIVIALGPAGTGKTILAVQYGIKLFQEGLISKIVITRPAVSVDEEIGFLPGSLEEKMAPWTRPIFDVFGLYYRPKDIARLMEEGKLEISPLAFMRGRTFIDSYIIADEIQGTTISQCKMLLTRIGSGSKMVVTGDLNQSDRLDNNGLFNFCNLIKGKRLEHISVVEFDREDIERHDAVKEVLSLYGE